MRHSLLDLSPRVVLPRIASEAHDAVRLIAVAAVRFGDLDAASRANLRARKTRGIGSVSSGGTQRVRVGREGPRPHFLAKGDENNIQTRVAGQCGGRGSSSRRLFQRGAGCRIRGRGRPFCGT
jgi:hypothetical protein